MALWPQAYLDMVEGLWNKNPITDVKLMEVDKNWGTSRCPDDYSIGAYYTWQGIQQACNCESSSKFTYGWKLGACNDTERGYYCKDIPDIGPKKLKVFEKNNVCVKRDKSMTYFDFVRPVKANMADADSNDHICPEKDRNGKKLKLCGEGSSMEYKMCIPESKECPI